MRNIKYWFAWGIICASVLGFILGGFSNVITQRELTREVVPHREDRHISPELEKQRIRLVKTTATAYNSLENQTDSTPWVTASGTKCRSGVIACNFLPIGTKVWIKGFGHKIFVVEDRMHKRFSDRIDIWMESHHEAIKFGKKQVLIAYIEKGGK